VIGDGQRRHPIVFGLFYQTFNGCRSIEKRVLGVNVQVRKLGHNYNLRELSKLAKPWLRMKWCGELAQFYRNTTAALDTGKLGMCIIRFQV
jgi:hypothetical protein